MARRAIGSGEESLALHQLLSLLSGDKGVSRRTFNKALAASGLCLGLSPFLSGCGSTDSGPSQDDGTAAAPEYRTLHFDLSGFSDDNVHTLRAGGRHHTLSRHSADTLAQARISSPHLIAQPDDRITHFATDVALSSTKPQRFHVTSEGPRGHALAAVGLHIPSASREAMRRARAHAPRRSKRRAYSDTGFECTISDEFADDFVTVIDTAKAILHHHPEIMSLDPDVSAIVDQHMDTCAEVQNLAEEICTLGPAYTRDPDYNDGWAVLVPMENDDGSQRLDNDGSQVYDYVFSDATSAALPEAVHGVLQLIKDDTSLAGRQYTLQYNDPTVDAGGSQTAARAAYANSAVQMTSTKPGWNDFVHFDEPGAGDTDRSFTIGISNMNFIYYGIYVQYLDADNNPVTSTEQSTLEKMLTDVTEIAQDVSAATTPLTPDYPEPDANWFKNLETDTIRFQGLCGPPATVLGIPIPSIDPQTLSVTLPDGTASARVMLCGPGAGGSVESIRLLWIGIILTLIVQFGIPMYTLTTAGSGEDEDKTLKDLIKKPGMIVKLLMAAKGIVEIPLELAEGKDASNAAESLVLSLASLGKAVVVALTKMLANGNPVALYEWLVEKFTEEEVEEAVPFVGWALRLITITTTLADMAVASAEIIGNPMVIDNTVTLTQSVTVTVYPDPEHGVFPLSASKLKVSIPVGPKTHVREISLSGAQLAQPSLQVTLDGIPSTGQQENIEVRLLSESGWMAAHSATLAYTGSLDTAPENSWVPGEMPPTDFALKAGSASFSNAPPTSGDPITVAVATKENPVPITPNTRYGHHQKLIYADGVYRWDYTNIAPGLETLDCGLTDGLCELGSISLCVPTGMIGYSWRAASTGEQVCGGDGTGQLHTFQTANFRADPNLGMKNPGCGFQGQSPVAFDPHGAPSGAGNHFYLDPVDTSTESPEYHLRKLVLDADTPVDVVNPPSWGRFRIPLDRLAVHPGGYVVGISTEHSKMGVLRIPASPYATDEEAQDSTIKLGQGTNSDGRVHRPLALTINRHGVILILEGDQNKRVKAFNQDGTPCKFFLGGTSSRLDLPDEPQGVTWLDLAVDPTDFLFLLSFVSGGESTEDYRLDVYKQDGTHLMRNTGIAVARMTVDPWRNLYSSNYETIAGSPRTEPSVSIWAPSTPTGTN